MENDVNTNVKNDVKKTKEILFFVFILLFFMLFEIIYVACGIDLKKVSSKTYMLLAYIKYFVFILIFVIRYRKYLKEKLKDFFKNITKHVGIGIKWWGIGFLAMMIINNILSRFITGVGTNEEIVQSYLDSEPLLMIIATTLFAPFVEEMIYRKSLQDCFKNKNLFIIVSGLLFGLAHVLSAKTPIEFLFILSYGAFGACFAKALVDSDNIYTTIFVHMVHNGILSLIAVLTVML